MHAMRADRAEQGLVNPPCPRLPTPAAQLGLTHPAAPEPGCPPPPVGIPAEQRSPAPYEAGIYSPSWTERTYKELLTRAAELLSHGESVIADASWIAADRRAAAAATAEGTAAEIVQLHCTAPAELTARRISNRKESASDADPMVAEKMAAAQAPWPEAITIDTSITMPPGPATVSAELVRRALHAIRPHQPEPVRRPGRPYMLPD